MNRIARCRVLGLLFASLAWRGLDLVSPAFGKDDAPPRLPVPSADALRAAEKQIREIFLADFTAAKKASEKSALAGKLWSHAENTEEDAIARYALLEAARVMAVEADEYKLAFNVIDSLAAQFEVSELELKTSALVANAKETRAATAQIEYCELIQTTIDAAARDKQFEAASKLMALLATSTAKIKDTARRKPFLTRHAELKQLQSHWTAVTKAKAALAKSPDDAAAHATYGRYLCLLAGDWDKGMPHLAQGTDSKLTTVARQDLGQRTTPEEQLGLADAWWALGQSEAGAEKQQLLLRANEWYVTASENLKGLSRTKADQRIDAIAKLYPNAVELQALLRSRRDGSTKLKSFVSPPSKSRPKGGADVPAFGELDRELIPKLLNARVQVGIKTVGQEVATFPSKSSRLPDAPFAITLISLNSKFVTPDALSKDDFRRMAGLINLESFFSNGVEIPQTFFDGFVSGNTLNQLSLVNAGASDATIAALSKLPRLKSLDLTDSTVSDASLDRIASYPALEILGVSRTRVTPQGFKRLTITTLKQLRAENLNLKDADLVAIADIAFLEDLNLSDESLTGEGFQSFRGRAPLKRLNLQHARLSNAGAARIAEIPTLQTLTLRNIVLDETKLKALCGRIRVESLTFQESTIPEAALTHLTANPALKLLHVEGTKITGAGWKGAKPQLTVTHVNLSKSALDDAGLAQVVRVFPNVTNLTLNETALTDAGLKPLRDLTRLEHLALGRTKITVKGLAELASLSKLNTIVIPSTVPSSEARAALPQCRNVSTYSNSK
ncbi:MAG: hypothetical protein AABP62_28405 [Planctomycetota bacterium]